MKNIQIQLPDFVTVEAKEIKLMLASKLYEDEKLSLGQAAEMAGVSKRAFMELLANYGVSVFNYDVQEIKEDFKNA